MQGRYSPSCHETVWLMQWRNMTMRGRSSCCRKRGEGDWYSNGAWSKGREWCNGHLSDQIEGTIAAFNGDTFGKHQNNLVFTYVSRSTFSCTPYPSPWFQASLSRKREKHLTRGPHNGAFQWQRSLGATPAHVSYCIHELSNSKFQFVHFCVGIMNTQKIIDYTFRTIVSSVLSTWPRVQCMVNIHYILYTPLQHIRWNYYCTSHPVKTK